MATRFNICIVDVHQLAAVVRNRIDNVLILDSRSFLEYNASHVINAINVGCAKLVKRRLQQNRLTIQDFLVHNCHWDVDTCIDIVVYDQNTQDPAHLPPDSFMSVFLEKLLPVYKSVNFLKGGFLDFQASYPNLCEDEKTKFTPLTSISQPCLPISNNGPTRILPFLYLGSQHDALNKEVLQNHNITYELNVSTNCPKPDFIQEARFMRIPVIDNYSDKLLPYFPRAFQFLNKVRESGGCVLVHCLAGISRSATVAIAYLMRHLKLSSDEAYRYVKAKRATISPNFNFLGQLLEYENQLQREKILDPKSESSSVSSAIWSEKYENEMFQNSLLSESKPLVQCCEPELSNFNLGILPELTEISFDTCVKSTQSTNKIHSLPNQNVNVNECCSFSKSNKLSPRIEAGEWSAKCIPVSSLKELNFTPCQAAVQCSTTSSKSRERYSPRQSNLWSAIDSFVKTNMELSEQVRDSQGKSNHFDFALIDSSLNECKVDRLKSPSSGPSITWPTKTSVNSLAHMQHIDTCSKDYTRSNSTSTSGLGSESSDYLESWSDYPSSTEREMDSVMSEECATVPMDDDEYQRRKMLDINDLYEETSLYSKYDDFDFSKNNNQLSSLEDCFSDYSPVNNQCPSFTQGESSPSEEKYPTDFKYPLNIDGLDKEDKKYDKPCGLYRAQSCPGIFSSELVPCSSTCDHIYTYGSANLRTTHASRAERACKQRNRYSCSSLDYVDCSVHTGLQKSCIDVPSFSSSGTNSGSTMSSSHQIFRRSMIQVS